MENKSFLIVFSNTNIFKVNDILSYSHGTVRVLKIYKYNLYRRFLNFLGFPFILKNHIKVINNDK